MADACDRAPCCVTHVLELAFYAAVVFVLAMGVSVILYRLGRPGHPGLRCFLPGTAVATVLWWAADIGFGLLCAQNALQRGVSRFGLAPSA